MSFHDMIMTFADFSSSQLSDHRYALTEQKRELTLVKELVRAMRLANPGVRALQVNLRNGTIDLKSLVESETGHPQGLDSDPVLCN